MCSSFSVGVQKAQVASLIIIHELPYIFYHKLHPLRIFELFYYENVLQQCD